MADFKSKKNLDAMLEVRKKAAEAELRKKVEKEIGRKSSFVTEVNGKVVQGPKEVKDMVVSKSGPLTRVADKNISAYKSGPLSKVGDKSLDAYKSGPLTKTAAKEMVVKGSSELAERGIKKPSVINAMFKNIKRAGPAAGARALGAVASVLSTDSLNEGSDEVFFIGGKDAAKTREIDPKAVSKNKRLNENANMRFTQNTDKKVPFDNNRFTSGKEMVEKGGFSFSQLAEVAKEAVKSGDAETMAKVPLDDKQKNKVLSILSSEKKTAAAIEASKEPEKASVSDNFTSALMQFLPLAAGSLIGGLDVGIAAQEGANEAVAAKAAGDIAKKEVDIKQQEALIKADQVKADTIYKQESIANDRVSNRIKQQLADQELLQINAKKNPSIAARLSALGSEDRKAVGNLVDANQAISDMKAAITRGVNKFSPVGDNLYTESRARFIESISRLKSGASISEKEYDLFTGMTPGTADEKAIVDRKMERIQEMVTSRFRINGFDPSEFELKKDKVTEALQNSSEEDIAAEVARRQGR